MGRFNAYLTFGVFLYAVIAAVILAGAYGILNDEITYTISPEYFTKFKYPQFGVHPAQFGSGRQTVAAIGFMAAWWMGLIIGIALGFSALACNNRKTMLRLVGTGLLITFCITVCMGFAGYLYGKFHLAKNRR